MSNSQKQNQIKKIGRFMGGGQARKERVKIENQITIPHK